MRFKELKTFFRHVRLGYLLLTSLLIVGLVFGIFEIIEEAFFSNSSFLALRWLYISRGIVSSVLLIAWVAWTVYYYREIYRSKLELKEGRYRDIIESSADAIITVDNDNRISYWNRGAEKILGWRRDEIIGKPLEILIPDELLESRELSLLEYGLRTSGEVTNYQTERLTKDGKHLLVSLTVTPLPGEQASVDGYSIIMRDLTELKLREEQVRHSERLATVGHMAAGVAHEIGNPLTAISSIVQVIQRKVDDDFAQERLEKVRENIKRINKIVRDLVDFSRPSSSEQVKSQLNEIIESAVGLLQHDARCRDVTFDQELDRDLPPIQCVPDHIHQVLVNLMLNAVDALENEDDPRITLRTYQRKNHLFIDVEDNGEGIEPEHIDHIFEPFFSTKEVGSGTGLGLSVSYGIVSKMDGTIDVTSEKGKGTCFIIKLPKKSTSQT